MKILKQILYFFIIHLLKYDTRVSGGSTGGAISPLNYVLVQLQYGAVRCFFPHLFLVLINEEVKYYVRAVKGSNIIMNIFDMIQCL